MSIDLDETTLPKLLKKNAEAFGAGRTALRQKAFGIWQQISWQDYYENVRLLSLGLTSLGLKPGERVAIVGNNRPASLYAQLAAQAAGAVSLALYPDATGAEVARILNLCRVRFVVTEDQEQTDKILERRELLPELAAVVYCDGRGMRNYRQEGLYSLDRVRTLGEKLALEQPELFEEQILAGRGDDVALICTTSGATGEPRAALISHRNLLSMARDLDQAAPKRAGDECVSFLPFAWFGEPMISLASALLVGFTVNFPEKKETALSDLREIGPQLIFSPPSVWESIASSVKVRIMDTTPFKRFMYHRCLSVGERVAALKLTGEAVPFSLAVWNRIAHICLFRALKDRLGLSRVRVALTGGSPLGSEVFSFFHALGIDLKQVYGLTELCGVACMHRDGEVRDDTVGRPLPGTEIRISSTGEILARGAGVFRGYFGDERQTAEAFEDGWLRTGDAGHLNELGHLVVTDRIEDLMKLSDGSLFPPQLAENKLKFSPYIKQALVVTGSRPGLMALICVDGGVLGKWAGDQKLNYGTYSDLAGREEVYGLIEREVAAVNLTLPESAGIGRFAILYKELDADEGELTRTGKLRRRAVAGRYRELIEAMEAGRETVPVDIGIELADGRSARIKTSVPIRMVGSRA